jgi:hypothetical protein
MKRRSRFEHLSASSMAAVPTQMASVSPALLSISLAPPLLGLEGINLLFSLLAFL